MLIATLIAADRLTADDVSHICALISETGAELAEQHWLEPGKAADIRFIGDLEAVRMAVSAPNADIDIIVQPEAGRAKRLFVADMDSTMITVECLDELADYVGFKAEVSAITERAMRGEIDFVEALDERVALLAGLDADIVTQCHDERVKLTRGARTLVRTMRANGTHCILVSGGFTLFADRVAAEIGFDQAIANRLEIVSGSLTGKVTRPVVDGAMKRRILREEAEKRDLTPDETLAVGDGANDLAMIRHSGLGVAYRGKPRLREGADARIDYGDLTALLYAQGYPRTRWVQP